MEAACFSHLPEVQAHHGPRSGTAFLAATLCVGEPHRFRRGTESLFPRVFSHRLQTSVTRATVEGSTASVGQTLRTERLLVGELPFHDVSRTCMKPCQKEFKPRVYETPRPMRACYLALVVGKQRRPDLKHMNTIYARSSTQSWTVCEWVPLEPNPGDPPSRRYRPRSHSRRPDQLHKASLSSSPIFLAAARSKVMTQVALVW